MRNPLLTRLYASALALGLLLMALSASAQSTDDSWVDAKYKVQGLSGAGQMSYNSACQIARGASVGEAAATCNARSGCKSWRETSSSCQNGLASFNYALKMEVTDIAGTVMTYEEGRFSGFGINAVCPDGTIVAFGSVCFVKNIDDRSCKAGNPVSPGSGEKFHDETDYSGAGAHPLEFRRSYRSNYRGLPSIATGWRHSWQKNIDAIENAPALYGNTILVKAPDGTHTVYTLNGTSWRALTNGGFDTLQETKVNGLRSGWVLKIWADDSTEYYDASGALLKIVQRNGWTTSLTYSTPTTSLAIAPFAGLLINITNHFGRKLQLRYNDIGQLIKLIDPAGGEIKYGYDTSLNLTKVTWQDNTAKQYVYGIPANGLLTGVIDELGVRIGTYAYDSQGRVISTEKTNGADKLTLLYNADKSTSITDYTPSPTGIGAPTATTRTHRFGTAQGVIRPVSVTAPCPTCGNTAASTAYDASGNVIQRTEHDGTTTKFTYDAKNRETSRVEKAGTANAITYTTQWHGTWNLPVLRVEPLKITAYTYDAKGNLTGQADTPTTDVNGSKATGGVRDLTLPIDSIGYTYDTNSLAVGNANATQIKNTQGIWVAKAKESFSVIYNSLGEIVSSTTIGTQDKIKSVLIDKHGNYLQIQASNLTITTMQFNPRNALTKFRGSGQSFTLDRALTGEILNVRNTNNTLASLFSPRPAMAQIGQIPGGGGLPGYYNPGAPSFWYGVGGVAGTSASNAAVAVNGAIGINILPTNKCESACWVGSRVACTAAGFGVGAATGGAASPLIPAGTFICGAVLTKQCYKAAKCSPCTK